ncbi:MAG: HD domain-containing protein [Acidobacteriota bacterium]|nr:MAG: HD domain-containing protein [Acidobacteriota bacterium]
MLQEEPIKVSRWSKLVYSLLGMMVLVAMVPLAYATWRLVTINKDSLQLNLKEYQMLAASSLSSEIELFFDRIEAQVEQINTAFEWGGEVVGARSMFDKAAQTKFLQRYLGRDMLYIRLSNLEERSWDATLFETLSPPLEKEILQASREAQQDRTFVSKPFFLEQDLTPILIMGFPLHIRERKVGALATVVSLESIVQAAKQRALTSGFTLHIVDHEGRALVTTALRSGASELPPGHPLLESFLEAMRRSPNTRASTTIPFERAVRREGPDQPDISKEPMVGTFTTIPALGWGILVEIEQARAYAAIRDMRRAALHISLAVLGIAVVASALLARYLTNPLRSLTESARRIASGDFSTRVSVRARNEIGVLADTFNKMASDMEASIERLTRMSEENQKMFMGTIRVLTAAIDAKDPYTSGHSERVTRYSMAIAKHLGFDAEQLKRVRIGALLHDVGKIGIEDAILGKTSQLDDEEFEIMKQHPEKGARIMAQIEPLRDVVGAIRYHHERYSGGGYPTGVSGDNIPLIARIIAVADTFDAMTTERPYQKAFTLDYATAKIYELRGSKYDPKVVEALVKAYRAGDIKEGMRDSVFEQSEGEGGSGAAKPASTPSAAAPTNK